MRDVDKGITRRGFITSVGMAGLGSILTLAAGSVAAAESAETSAPAIAAIPKGAKLATRKFGKTDVDVSILSLGGMFNILSNQIMLKKCLDWGLTYWDTADCYENGGSEEGIGMFFEKFPDERKKVFLVTKSDKRDPTGMTELLEQSLKRMKTDHIDLYFIHGVNDIKEITGETKAWMEKAKADKKIKFFGFSAHKNMQTLLVEAAKLGWIDGIMMTYNYRLMQEDKMKAAIEACVKAGIGLTAMKSQGGGPVKTDSEAELKLAGHFIQKGFTQHQAKLKAVWQNPDIASICSQMPSMAILTQNVAAALDNSKLTAADWDALRTYEKETASSYCAGCRHHCESALGRECHVSDLMRCMMYHVSYGDTQLARQTFAQLPSEMRLQLGNMDFAAAERACPRGLSIGQIAREALKTLA